MNNRQNDSRGARRLWLAAAGVVAAALVVSVVGLFQQPAAFRGALLTAVVFWLGTSLGCLGIALLHALTGGVWGEAIRRDLRAGAAAGAVGLIAIVPLGLNAAELYPGAGSAGESVLNAHQQEYFTWEFTAARTAAAVLVWCGLAVWLVRAEFRRDVTAAAMPAVSPRKAALGLLAFWLTVSFAVVDGVMSLTPGWASSLFPMMQIIGFAVAGMSVVIVARGVSPPADPWDFRKSQGCDSLTEAARQTTHDLGNLLLAFNLVWVYLSFSQYLIIWSGDLPHEVAWYLDRRRPLAAGGATALLLLHFVVPFGLLLSRPLKRDHRRLACVAALLLVMRLVAEAWTILPATRADETWAVLLTTCIAIVLGAAWLLAFLQIRARLPVIGPSCEERESTHAVPKSIEGTA